MMSAWTGASLRSMRASSAHGDLRQLHIDYRHLRVTADDAHRHCALARAKPGQVEGGAEVGGIDALPRTARGAQPQPHRFVGQIFDHGEIFAQTQHRHRHAALQFLRDQRVLLVDRHEPDHQRQGERGQQQPQVGAAHAQPPPPPRRAARRPPAQLEFFEQVLVDCFVRPTFAGHVLSKHWLVTRLTDNG
jgi:hypothetical protein